MRRRLRAFGQDEGGQILAIAVAFALVLVVFLLTMPNVTRVISHKVRTQTAADAGAFSAMTWTARGMNIIHSANYGIAAMYIDMALDATLWGVSAILYYLPFGATQAIAIAIDSNMFKPGSEPVGALDGLVQDLNRLIGGAELIRDAQDAVLKGIPEYAQYKGDTVALRDLEVSWPGDECAHAVSVYSDVDNPVLTDIPISSLLGPIVSMMNFISQIGGLLGDNSSVRIEFDKDKTTIISMIPKTYVIHHLYARSMLVWNPILRRYERIALPPEEKTVRHELWNDEGPLPGEPLAAKNDRDKYIDDGAPSYMEGTGSPPDWVLLKAWDETTPGEKREERAGGAPFPRTLPEGSGFHAVAFACHPTTKASDLWHLFRGGDIDADQFAFAHAELVPPDETPDITTPFKVKFRARLSPVGKDEATSIKTMLDDAGVGHGFSLEDIVDDGILNH